MFQKLNTVKVFAEVLLEDDEICRRVVLDKKWCKDQTFDLPTLVFYRTFPCVSCQDKNTTLLLEENKRVSCTRNEVYFAFREQFTKRTSF